MKEPLIPISELQAINDRIDEIAEDMLINDLELDDAPQETIDELSELAYGKYIFESCLTAS